MATWFFQRQRRQWGVGPVCKQGGRETFNVSSIKSWIFKVANKRIPEGINRSHIESEGPADVQREAQ